jgi:hypothetical protein
MSSKEQLERTISNYWNNSKLTPEEQNDLLVEICREVFATNAGKVVLNMLMTDLHLFEFSDGERDRYLNDYAKFFIRHRLGVRDTKNMTDFIAETAASEGGL